MTCLLTLFYFGCGVWFANEMMQGRLLRFLHDLRPRPELSLVGDGNGSRRQIRAAVKAWPGIKGDLVEDRELEALWGG